MFVVLLINTQVLEELQKETIEQHYANARSRLENLLIYKDR